MPFTLAHPAAVVFIKNKYLNLTALVLGSMAPDFIYFLLFTPSSNIGHTVWGSIFINIPICFFLNFIYYRYIKDPFIYNLPSKLYENYSWLMKVDNKVINVREIFIFIYSSILGMITHVFWDSFTHKTGYFVSKIEFLRSYIDIFGHKIYLYKIGQHGGTLVGFVIIAIYIYNLRNNQKVEITNTNSKIKYHLISILIMILTISSIYFIFDGNISLGRLVVSLINGLLLGYLVSSIIYKKLILN